MSDRVITISESELDVRITSKVADSHSSIAKSVSGFGSDLKKGLEEISRHSNQLDVMQYKIDANNESSKTGLSTIDKKIDEGFKDVNEKLADFITKDQFWPVKTIVYGCLAIVLTGVVGAALTLVFSHNIKQTSASIIQNDK